MKSIRNTLSHPVGELRTLCNLIQSSIDQIESALLSRSQQYPSFDEPFTPESEAVRMSGDVLAAGDTIIAAAGQLIAAVSVPSVSLVVATSLVDVTACLGVAANTHVAEILREAGPQGAHVRKIAAASSTGIDPGKLARVLRLLCTNHIFRELTPNVFVNNRISSLMDTGKLTAEIVEDVEAKHDNTNGLAALVEHLTDKVAKSTTYLSAALLSREFAASGEPEETALNIALNVKHSAFALFDLPEYKYEAKRFGIAMGGTQNMSAPGTVVHSYDWESIPTGSTVVDVGGGLGFHVLALVKAVPHLNYVVQDQPAVIEKAKEIWNVDYPEAIKSGQVKLQAHDFFTPQPVHTPALYFLRSVMHDWSDTYCAKILRHLRDAAGPQTRLLLAESILSHACSEDSISSDVPGYRNSTPSPEPLLANGGISKLLPYIFDINMLSIANGGERTALQWDELLKMSGWKLVYASHNADFELHNAKLLAEPA